MTINVGVIGAGYLGRHHARIYSQLDGVRLVAVVDCDMDTAREVAGLYGAEALGDYRSVLDRVDALSIVTPTVSHHDIAMDCLRAGKGVLVEKPITATVGEADDLIREAESKGVVLQVGHLERFNPAVVALAGHLEDTVFIESERVSPMQGRGLDVDVTLDLMIHDIDIVRSFLGGSAIRDIRVVGSSVLTENIDVAKAWVEFDCGVTALITASRISMRKARTLKLYQKHSYVMLDYQLMKITKYAKKGSGIVSEAIDIEGREPLKEELVDFIDCIRTRRRPRVSGVEGRDALEVALAISEKIRNLGR